MLSVWDSKSKESMRIDLWTKEMPVDEMKIFFHQTLVAMSDTFHRATVTKNGRDHERFLRIFCRES
jgi:gliding motility-associated protein GldC